MSISRSKKTGPPLGFTIVELLIVIVVIAILAAISIVAYTGIQDRSISVQRLNDMNTIVKALEMYKVQKGEYPPVQSNSSGGWERSAANPSGFLDRLISEKIINQVPVDPKNLAPEGAYGPEALFVGYAYYRYPPGHAGCDVSLGHVIVLKIEEAGRPVMKESPGLSCGSILSQTYRGTRDVYYLAKSTN